MDFSIKPIYFILGCALWLSSCSQGDEPRGLGGEGERILFRTSMPGVSSRGKEITKDNLRYFYVSAFDFDDATLVTEGWMRSLFANQKISMDSTTSTYSSPSCRWPVATKESDVVSFFGFYPGLGEIEGAQLVNASTPSNLNYKLTGFRVASDIADQVDFVTAYTQGTMAENVFSGVTLPFAHQLSRIEIKAFGSHKSCDIEIAGVRIGGAGVRNTFEFKPIDGGGVWAGEPERGMVEYVFRKNDKIISFGVHNPVKEGDALSIMGAKRDDGNDNFALVMPGDYSEWNVANDSCNASNRLFISVLIRITDATVNAGVKPVDKQRYPYTDLSQGDDALQVPVEYLAINKESGEVAARLYKKDGRYFSDKACKVGYNLPSNHEIKEFGWAAVPVGGIWKPRLVYTYVLDYSQGVGLLEPSVATTSPAAGDPVINGNVGFTYTVKEWHTGGGDEFIVPNY